MRGRWLGPVGKSANFSSAFPWAEREPHDQQDLLWCCLWFVCFSLWCLCSIFPSGVLALLRKSRTPRSRKLWKQLRPRMPPRLLLSRNRKPLPDRNAGYRGCHAHAGSIPGCYRYWIADCHAGSVFDGNHRVDGYGGSNDVANACSNGNISARRESFRRNPSGFCGCGAALQPIDPELEMAEARFEDWCI